MRIRWALDTLRNDARRLLAGIAAFRRHGRDSTDVQVSLSMFSTSMHIVREGAACTYVIVVANRTHHDRCQRLRVDIEAAGAHGGARGHYASFEKDLLFAGRRSAAVSVTFDWKDHVRFDVDGVMLKPDALSLGLCRAAGPYLVRGALLDVDGARREELTLVQRLSA